MAGLLMGSCASLQTGTETYTEAWDEVVDSEPWAISLNEPPPTSDENPEYYAVPAFNVVDTVQASPEFIKQYPVWVSRAYFRLISEAMESDQKIARSYQDLYRKTRVSAEGNTVRMQQEFETAEKRFLAHREMLNGLRSWNAFNRYGSNDLDFFMQEEFDNTYQKYERGVREDDIVDYLMRRLADLYHQTYGGLTAREFLPG
jgi:hypothetical protein